VRKIVSSKANAVLLDAARAFLSEHAGKTQVVVLGATKAAADEFVRGASDHGCFGVHALTLTQLAATVAGPAMGEAGLAPLTRLGAEAVAARVAHTAFQAEKLQYFSPVAEMPGFARAVAATLRELRLQGVGAQDLKKAGKPGADLALLLQLFDEQLEERRLADLADVLGLATQEVADRGHRLAGLPLLLLDLPLDYKAQREFVQVLVDRSPSVLALELGNAGFSLCGFPDPETGLETCFTPLDRVRRYLFSAETPEGVTSDSSLIFSAPGEGLECVEIARRIRALAESGTPFDRIAILLRDPIRYQPLMEDALRRAGIPEYFSRGTARPDPGGRAFLALLACAGEGCTATRFAEYLSLGQVPALDQSGAPPRPPRTFVAADDELIPGTQVGPAEEEAEADVGMGLVAPANWEKLLVDAAVVGGYERWERRLRGLENELKQKLAETRRDDDPARARIERQIEHLGNLARFALPLIEYLHSLPDRAAWGVWIDRLSDLAGMALRWPESVLAVLAELQPMSDVGPVELDEVYGVLADRLGTLRREPPRRRYGRVFVGSIEEARGRVFDVVFLPGLAEGVFPKRAFEDPLLLDDGREAVSPYLGRRRDRDVRERLLLRIAAAAPANELIVSYPRVNVEQSRPRVPSFYALEVLRAAEGRLPNLREFEKRAAAGSPTRLDWPAPREATQAIDDAEYDLAWLKASGNAKGSGRYLIEASKTLADSLRMRWKRWDRRKWWDGDGIVDPDTATLAALNAHRLRARSYSPSSLQQFASCPYKFLLYAICQLRPREESVALEQMDPLTRGALFHQVQFESLCALREQGLLPFPADGMDRVLAIADEALNRVAKQQKEDLAPAIPRVWENEIEDIRTDLRGWVQHAAMQREWVPARFEFAFGLKEHTDHRDPSSTSAEAKILNGVRVRGSIDLIERRIDLIEGQRDVLRITDHKTGKAPESGPVHVSGGTVLQPVVYALAAEQLLNAKVESSRLFYCTQRGDYSEYHVTINDDARRRTAQVFTIIDGAIAGGFLPAAPLSGTCAFCDYQPVCGPYEEQRTQRKPKNRLDDLNVLRSLP
jgi:ATP-dependent helicase/nuclease subunit B